MLAYTYYQYKYLTLVNGVGGVLKLLKYDMVIATTLWEENTHPNLLREKHRNNIETRN